MTIYCKQCGKELPDDANFCLKCGKSVSNAAQSETRSETCEIVCIRAGFLGGKSYFVARAAGAKGVYEAARSTKTFGTKPTTKGDEPQDKKDSGEALNEIMTALSADDWQPLGTIGEWWEYRYRRLEH